MRNAERQAAGFRTAGADDVRIIDDGAGPSGFGRRVREAAADLGDAGLVLLGSGSVPLATAADRRAFVAVGGGPPGHALTNNRYSADVIAVAGGRTLAGLPDVASDNGLPRWLAEQRGFAVDDLRGRWRLQVDLDGPLDALLLGASLGGAVPTEAVLETLARVRRVAADAGGELVIAGRTSAGGLAWLEGATASRTRALVEERGFRTRTDPGQRPVASTLGLLLESSGPDALGAILARLGDAAFVDSRVLLAQRFGADERAWPAAEDRFASDLLLADRIADPWLRALTAAARDAPIPIVLGGHSLVGPGLRLVFGRTRRWT